MTDVQIKKLEKSEVEITGELPEKDFVVYRKEALEKIGKNIEVPGFRKGHIPENVLTKKIPETTKSSQLRATCSESANSCFIRINENFKQKIDVLE